MEAPGVAPLLMLAAFVASIWLHIKVLRKAGRSGWWMLLAIVFPLFYLIGVWLFAFGRWPAEERLKAAEGRSGLKGQDTAWPYHSDPPPP